MLVNKPYVKEYKGGVLVNPITTAYLHQHPTVKAQKEALKPKYQMIYHWITKEFLGKMKVGGNNRKWRKASRKTGYHNHSKLPRNQKL